MDNLSLSSDDRKLLSILVAERTSEFRRQFKTEEVREAQDLANRGFRYNPDPMKRKLLEGLGMIQIEAVDEVLEQHGRSWNDAIAHDVRNKLKSWMDKEWEYNFTRPPEMKEAQGLCEILNRFHCEINKRVLRARLSEPRISRDKACNGDKSNAESAGGSPQSTDDILEIKPNFIGIGLNLNAAWRRWRNRGKKE